MKEIFLKLTYQDYIENLDFYLGEFNVTAPNLAKELDLLGCESISALDFYNDIFGTDNLKIKQLEKKTDKKNYKQGEYGAIALEINERYKKRTTITYGLDELFKIIDESDNFCLMSPISYAGKNRTLKNARFMYALCVEIDYLKPNGEGIENLFYSFERESYPNLKPTYIVCSGNGLHLYYKFKEPLAMFANNQIKLTRIKKAMTFNLWNYIADRKEKIQYESINQAFRIVGTLSKGSARAMVFKVGGEITMSDLESFYRYKESEYRQPNRFSLDEAKEKFPEWYEKRIINNEPRKSLQFKKNRAIYDKWKERILYERGGAVDGTRFYCLEQLCALAVVCDISRDELLKDCKEILPEFERRTKHDDNHFTEYDIKSALATYDNPNDSTYCRRLSTIYKKTNINLPRVRRNGRKRADHLKFATLARDLKYPNGEWRNKDGRPSKEKEVQEWRRLNPNGKKADCHRETKISRPTIDKFWNL